MTFLNALHFRNTAVLAERATPCMAREHVSRL